MSMETCGQKWFMQMEIFSEINVLRMTLTFPDANELSFFLPSVTLPIGRVIAQAVSRWLPTALAQVRARVRSCGICGGQSGT
jgi:hypothetical protein